MGKTAGIEIFMRVRPSKKYYDKFLLDTEEKALEIQIPRDKSAGYVNNKREVYKFKFNGVFDQQTKQEEIFTGICKEIIDTSFEGYNGTLFAYGQTGSGKTYTMTGGPERYADRGIIPRSLSYIFSQCKKRTDTFYKIGISYLEIYNNSGYDLLDENHSTKQLSDLPKVIPRDNQNEQIYLDGLSIHKAENEEDALNLLFIGDTNRVVCETPKHDQSTRSHCIFIVQIEATKHNSDVKTVSKLHLVDLAGSERVGKTGVEGKLLKEAAGINAALHFLELVIVSLQKKARGENIHISYRNSLMTMVLRDSLGGNCKTRMIATASADEEDIDETICTLNFAQRVAMIQNKASKNESLDPALIIQRLKQENAELKAEVAMLKGTNQKSSLEAEDITALHERIKQYINATDPSQKLIISDRLEVNETFHHLKHMIINFQNNTSQKQNNSQPPPPSNNNSQPVVSKENGVDSLQSLDEIKRLKMLIQQRDNEIMILLNLIKKNSATGGGGQQTQMSMAIGNNINSEVSHDQANESKVMTFPKYDQLNSELQTQGGTSMISEQKTKIQESQMEIQVQEVNKMLYVPLQLTNEQLMDRAQTFELFRKSYRKNQAMEENKELLKEKFEQGKKLGTIVNQARLKVNQIKNTIEELRRINAINQITNNTDQPISQEEQNLTQEINNQKSIYKTNFEQLKELKQEIERIQLHIEQSRQKLQLDFEKWIDLMMKQKQIPQQSQLDSQLSGLPNVKDKKVQDKLEAFYKARDQIYQN